MVSYRDAKQDDIQQIVDIYNSTVQSGIVTADTEPVTVASRQEWFNKHSGENRPLWVVEAQGKMAGWVSFQDFYGRPAYRYTAEISIYLHEDFRGKGLGKTALAHILQSCNALQIKTLLGYIFAHNHPSINLFTHAGFTEWGHLPDIAEISGVERTLKIFGKKIY